MRGTIPDKVELKPEAENVEFAYEAPSPTPTSVWDRSWASPRRTTEEARKRPPRTICGTRPPLSARSLVTIDENTGEPMPLADKTKVKLVGRAYKPVD